MDSLASRPDAGGCCGGDHQHSHAHHDHDDVDVLNDPTLMSCCDKDRVAYDRAMALKSLLTDHDPTTQNVRMRQQVVAAPPQVPSVTTTKAVQAQAATAAAAIAEKLRAMEIPSDEEDDDSDLDLDEDFDALFAARRQELAAQFEAASKNAADGYGIILETDFQALLKELTAQPEVPRVAFVRPSSLNASASHEMLTQMLALASRFLGTKFYSISTDASTDQESLRQLRLSTAPTVVAFRRGQRVDATAIQEKELAATSASILWEARLVPWLTMCNVLETVRQDAPTSSDGRLSRTTSLQRGQAGEPEGDEGAFDCGVSGCRIRFAYEHEHVGPSQEAKAEISAWRTPSAASTPA